MGAASAFGVALLAAAAPPPSGSGHDDPAPARVVRLLSPDTRDAALCELLNAGRYEDRTDWADCKVNAVVAAPQVHGPPIYVVFKDEDFSRDDAHLGDRKGHFILISSGGQLLPIYGNDNLLDHDGELFEFAGDGRLALALVIDYDGFIRTLNIVPVELRPRSLLSVVVGPRGKNVPTGEVRRQPRTCSGDVCFQSEEIVTEERYPWSWRLLRRGAAPPAIELAPNEAMKANHPAATFTWSYDRYVGPKGSVAKGFLRFNPDQPFCAVDRMLGRDPETDPAIRYHCNEADSAH